MGHILYSGAGTWMLPLLIGLQSALRLLYAGEFVSADASLDRRSAMFAGT